MNHIHLIGRLGADPRITPYNEDKGAESKARPRFVVSFDLAVERPGYHPQTGEVSTDWIAITVFDGAAGRFAADHLSKGDRIAVTGRLEATSWGSPDRALRKTVRVVAREIIGLDYHRDDPLSDAKGVGHPIPRSVGRTRAKAASK